jgi:hypothetical protein
MNWNALLHNPGNSVAQACESGTMRICFDCDIAMTKPFTAMTWVLWCLLVIQPWSCADRRTCYQTVVKHLLFPTDAGRQDARMALLVSLFILKPAPTPAEQHGH